MRVLIVTNMYPFPQLTHYGAFVADHVSALRRSGLEVDVFFTNPRLGKHRYATDVPRLARLLRSNSYDVINAHHTYSVLQTLLSRRLARCRAPLVFTLHEGELHAPTGARARREGVLKRLVYLRGPKRFALNSCDAVVSVEARLPGVAGFSGAFRVIPPAVASDRFAPLDRSEARRALNLPPDELVVLFPANPARPEKGWELFERARAQLNVNVRVLVGGSIAPDEMPLYMNAANVVVQTSHFEASPMVIKEAMACNTPVVSTNVGDVADLVNGLDGCLCVESTPTAVAEAIEDALARGGSLRLRERIIDLGLEPDAVARQYLDVFASVAVAA